LKAFQNARIQNLFSLSSGNRSSSRLVVRTFVYLSRDCCNSINCDIFSAEIINLKKFGLRMAEIEPDIAPASGFKVRPLSRVVKGESSLAEPQSASGRKQEAGSNKQEKGDDSSRPLAETKRSRLRELTDELRAIEAQLRLGGGPEKIAKQHKARKLTARERIDLLLDPETYRQEIGLLVAYDQYREPGAKGK
jgi:hypothetical protein